MHTFQEVVRFGYDSQMTETIHTKLGDNLLVIRVEDVTMIKVAV